MPLLMRQLSRIQVSRGLPKKKTPNPKAKAAGNVGIHPRYSEMVSEAIAAIGEKKGSSRAAILNYIIANYKVSSNVDIVNAYVKTSLKSMVAAGSLKQMKGHGARGSFRISAEVGVEAAKKAKAPTVAKNAVTLPQKANKNKDLKKAIALASPSAPALTFVKKIIAVKEALMRIKPSSLVNKSPKRKFIKKVSSKKVAKPAKK